MCWGYTKGAKSSPIAENVCFDQYGTDPVGIDQSKFGEKQVVNQSDERSEKQIGADQEPLNPIEPEKPYGIKPFGRFSRFYGYKTG